MKKGNKSNKIKEKEILTDEQTEIKRFIIILTSLVVVIIGIFIFTKYVINDGDVTLPLIPSTPGTVNYSVTTVGTMLTKGDSEYYVALYDATADDAVLYASVMSTYLSKENSLQIYFADLDNSLNHDYIATEEKPENTAARNINDLSLGDVTLLKISSGQIVEYYSGLESIKNALV